MELNPVNWIQDARRYLHEVNGEFKKITWPPQKEVVSGTMSVVVVVTIITTALFFVDTGLSQVMSAILQ